MVFKFIKVHCFSRGGYSWELETKMLQHKLGL